MLTEGWVYGLDVNSSCVGIGMIDVKGKAWRTQGCAWRPRRGGVPPLPHSLNWCLNGVTHFLAILGAEFPAAAVAIERPSGFHNNPSLTAHWGAVNVAAYRALQVTPFNYNGATDWRKALGLPHGQGKAGSLAYAESFGLDVAEVGEDQAEGLCIAVAAYRQMAGVRRLALRPWSPVGT